jgi:osmotically-inducible protein OsmY
MRYAILDDGQLQKVVEDQLNWDPSIVSEHIGVTVKNGVVTLTGHVASFAAKYEAEAAAGKVRGIKGIAEELEVHLPFDGRREDSEIAEAALNRMSWDVSVPKDMIKVKVEKGWVTLNGKVDWHYQRDAAEQDVRGLYGVVGLSNQISITVRPNALNVRDDILSALHRTWTEPHSITVEVDDGTIRLSGNVHSQYEREMAVTTAWAASGAKDVVNSLVVA